MYRKIETNQQFSCLAMSFFVEATPNSRLTSSSAPCWPTPIGVGHEEKTQTHLQMSRPQDLKTSQSIWRMPLEFFKVNIFFKNNPETSQESRSSCCLANFTRSFWIFGSCIGSTSIAGTLFLQRHLRWWILFLTSCPIHSSYGGARCLFVLAWRALVRTSSLNRVLGRMLQCQRD